MTEPPIPVDETQRLHSLHALKILDTSSEERFDRITRLAARMYQVPIAVFSLVDANRQWFKSREGLEACETSRAVSFCGHAIIQDHVFVVEDAQADVRFRDNPLVTGGPRIRFYAGCPVHAPDGPKIGTLCLIDREPRGFSADDREMLQDLAQMVERELASVTQATTDELTRISNRRGFREVSSHVLGLCRRFGRPAYLAMFDLDNFKPINDRYGHEEGDRLLREFSRALLKTFRDSDVVARLGGDEFCTLLSGVDLAGVRRCLQRLQESIDSVNASGKRPGQLGFTAGAVAYDPARHQGIDDLMREADARMYDLKRAKKKQTA